MSTSLDSRPNFRFYIGPSGQLGLGLIELGVVSIIYHPVYVQSGIKWLTLQHWAVGGPTLYSFDIFIQITPGHLSPP